MKKMFEDKNPAEKEGQDYGLKTFMDAASNKVLLIFSLFNHRLNEWKNWPKKRSYQKYLYFFPHDILEKDRFSTTILLFCYHFLF